MSAKHGRGVATITLTSEKGVFMISVAAELANMHPQTLRTYEARGLIRPGRSPKGTRLYSQRDVEKLRRIGEMTAEMGMNLAGVERVLELEADVERMDGEVARMQARLEELEMQALAAEVRLAEELEAVRRSFRAELVPYRDPAGAGTEIVLASKVRPLRPRRRSGGGDAA